MALIKGGDPTDFFKEGYTIQPLKNYTPYNDAQTLMAVQSILDAALRGQSTIVDANLLPTTMMGATIDWSVGTADDDVYQLTIHEETLIQDASQSPVSPAPISGMTDQQAVIFAVQAVVVGLGTNPDMQHITSNLIYPTTGLYSTTISWSSSANISNSGVVTRPSGTDATMIITATVTKGSASTTRNFTATVLKVVNLGGFITTSTSNISSSTKVMKTTDGTNWTNETNPGNNGWQRLAWSPTLAILAAVGNTGVNQIMTSTNGINWVSRTTASGQWKGICWGGPNSGIFVAVSQTGNQIMTSPDGVTWSTVSVPTGQWQNVCWSPSLSIFVAVASNSGAGNWVMTSPDGVTWTAHTVSNGNWVDVCWSPSLNLFVAIASVTTNNVMTSSDGINWSYNTISGYTFLNVSWSSGLGMFMATGWTASWHSTDGITWAASTGGSPWVAAWSSDLNLFSGIGNDGEGNLVPLISTTGTTWTSHPLGSNYPTMAGVIWVHELNLFVAVGAYSNASVATSPDGVSWTFYSVSVDGTPWASVCWSPDLQKFVAVGQGTNAIMTSSDGSYWTKQSMSQNNYWANVVWSPNENIFVAVATGGSSGHRIATSPDGITWTPYATNIATPSTNWYGGIAFSPTLGIYVAVGVGNGANMASSTDAITWINRTPGTASYTYFQSVAWISDLNMFIALGANGKNAYSSDGITWTITSGNPSGIWHDMAWSPSLHLLVASNSDYNGTYGVMTSPDGIVWTGRTKPTGAYNSWQGIAWSSTLNKFIACHNSNSADEIRGMQSSDGISWTAIMGYPSGKNPNYTSIIWMDSVGFIMVGSGVSISTDGTTWTDYTTGTAAQQFGKIIWSVTTNKYIATDQSSPIVYTSTDAINWDNGTNLPDAYYLSSIIDIQNKIVGITVYGTTFVSVDATNWTPHYNIETGYWTSIAFSSQLNRFLIGNSSAVLYKNFLTSTDGINWSLENIDRDSGAAAINCLCWSPDLQKFIALTNSPSLYKGGKLLSSDGVNWTQSTAVHQAGPLAWSPSLNLVAVNDPSYGSISVSSDTNSWLAVPTSSGGYLFSGIAWSPALNKFVTVGYSNTTTTHSGAYSISSDGKNWTVGQLPQPSTYYQAICWNSDLNLFLILSINGQYTATSPDGTTWTSHDISAVGVYPQIPSLCWSHELGLFAFTADDNSTGNPCVVTSPDGITWTKHSAPYNYWGAICWSSDLHMFATVANYDNGGGIGVFLTSTDGVTWVDHDPGLGGSWNDICWSHELGLFAAVGRSGASVASIMTSPDGTNWTSHSLSGIANQLSNIIWSSQLNLFIATGLNSDYNATIVVSSDGSTWNNKIFDTDSNNWSSVCWSHELGLFAAVASGYGSGNRIMTSPDGINWTGRISPADNTWVSVDWNSGLGMFIAVSSDGTSSEMTSTDGITWTLQTSLPQNQWSHITSYS
jgi:Atrophied bacterial Ig domain